MKCSKCNGSGMYSGRDWTGKTHAGICSKCNGTGKVKGDEEVREDD